MRRMALICLMLIAGCGPRPDTREELRYLRHQFDSDHAYEVVLGQEYDKRTHYGCQHDGRFFFERGCATCDANCRNLCRQAELLHRHPEWKPPPEPPRYPEETPNTSGKPLPRIDSPV